MSKTMELPYKLTKSSVVIGPFDAVVRSQGQNQRGVLIPKFYHDLDWFQKLMTLRKPKMTVEINGFSFGPFNAAIFIQGENQRGVFIPKQYHKSSDFKKITSDKYPITITVSI